MRRGKWTLLLISELGDEFRQLTFRSRTLRLALGGAGFCCLSVFAVLGLVGLRGGQALHTTQIEREREILVGELEQIRSRVTELEGELDFLAQRDAEIRVMAGLDPIDPEVLQVGVGGPGAPTLESHPLFELNEDAGEQAFAATYDLNALERRSRLLQESLIEASDSLAAHRDLLDSTPSILPTAGRLSSGFTSARMHPIHNQVLPHEGVDISAPRGTPIMAAAKGRVVFAGQRSGYGMVVELDHGFGYSTVYGHASKLLVTRGQQVRRGEVIAQVGSSGLATSPHLHYEVRVANRPVNPMNFVLSGVVP
ncbi:MAG: M23 family metallopeptidase [Gemmatimonadota bacterium]